jgi:hypothetical protein
MRNPISGAATTRDIVLLAASDIGAPLTSFTLAGAMQSPELESEPRQLEGAWGSFVTQSFRSAPLSPLWRTTANARNDAATLR